MLVVRTPVPSPRSFMTTSRQVRLARRPDGEPGDDTYSFEDHELPALEDGQLLLRVVYLSLDPYMRGRLSDAPSYA
jgi:NADPH-dependent curcumin reductase CurA